jgi:pimeloyl-ACP methyl ester carboxylesterase
LGYYSSIALAALILLMFAAPCGAVEHGYPRLYVVMIGGMDSDPSPEQIAGTAKGNEGNSGLYRLAGEMGGEQCVAEYFNWNGTRAGRIRDKTPPVSEAIVESIRTHLTEHPGDRLAIVGNSWGGHTALEVCQKLGAGDCPLAVQELVLLDPSSAGRARLESNALPVNVNRVTNYYTRNLFGWRKWLADRRLEHVDLGDPAQGYMHNGQPMYDQAFNFPAHVAAEWDRRIHDDIRRRVEALLEGGVVIEEPRKE